MTVVIAGGRWGVGYRIKSKDQSVITADLQSYLHEPSLPRYELVTCVYKHT